ncbi:hypothetical protein GALMADRAFT_136288 [Galerina marginata CBS 339.88]|uniref:Uncharacterized protein n=1 Tax=Galerina marginata (strain CBS 339.88) TaxID=685588 RepID=A0A067TMW1_GALM3|nr:hypothetical protein GALMADRAFT_136288 [Galerina marginata CBS 339.88]
MLLEGSVVGDEQKLVVTRRLIVVFPRLESMFTTKEEEEEEEETTSPGLGFSEPPARAVPGRFSTFSKAISCPPFVRTITLAIVSLGNSHIEVNVAAFSSLDFHVLEPTFAFDCSHHVIILNLHSSGRPPSPPSAIEQFRLLTFCPVITLPQHKSHTCSSQCDTTTLLSMSLGYSYLVFGISPFASPDFSPKSIWPAVKSRVFTLLHDAGVHVILSTPYSRTLEDEGEVGSGRQGIRTTFLFIVGLGGMDIEVDVLALTSTFLGPFRLSLFATSSLPQHKPYSVVLGSVRLRR